MTLSTPYSNKAKKAVDSTHPRASVTLSVCKKRAHIPNLSCNLKLHHWMPILLIIPSVGLFSSCSFGQPETRAYISNVRAKPESHTIAVALRYERFQNPSGFINTFPNGGIPQILDQKAKIYLCDAETGDIKKAATVSPEKIVQLGWEPWVMGWIGDSLFFKISGQSGTSVKDIRDSKPLIYCIHANGRLLKLKEAPEGLEFQSNTGPMPQGSYVRYSKDHNTIDVRTENRTEAKTLFKIEFNDAELVPVKESNKSLESTANAGPQR